MFRVTTSTTFRNAVQAVFKKDVGQIGTSAFRAAWPSYNVANAVSPSGQKRGIFFCDVGLGLTSPLTSAHCKKHELSNDDNAGVIRSLFNAPITDEKEKLSATYMEAVKQVRGRKLLPYDIKGPWEDLEFTKRSLLKDPKVSYATFYRTAVRTGMSRTVQDGAISRQGEVHFFLGEFDAKRYVDSIVRTEYFTEIPFSKFAATMSIPALIQDDEKAKKEGRGKTPSLTSIELYDSSMGEFQEAGKKFKWFAEDETPLDFKKLQRLQEEAFSAARMLENIELLIETGKMTEAAKTAIANLQQYISTGTLPD